jgi:hypothetical protein
MIRDLSRKYYEIWGNEEAQNTFLKGILVALSVLFILQSIALVIVSLRHPILITVGEKQTQIIAETPPSEDLLSEELKRQVTHYVDAHYTWDFTTVEKSHELASHYISAQFLKAFQQANLEQIKIAKEKKLSEKVYFASLVVDPKQLSAQVTLDRILMIDGIRAVTPLNLSLTLEAGPRTETNPEGLYITGEKIMN